MPAFVISEVEVLDLAADDLADLHAPDAVYEFPPLSPSPESRSSSRTSSSFATPEA